MADFSAAVLYQNDVAMAQSPLPNAELTTQINAILWLNCVRFQRTAQQKYIRGSKFSSQQYGIQVI